MRVFKREGIYHVAFQWNLRRHSKTLNTKSLIEAKAKAKVYFEFIKTKFPKSLTGHSPYFGRAVPLSVLSDALLAKKQNRADRHHYKRNLNFIVAQLGSDTAITKINDAALVRLRLSEQIRHLLERKRDLDSTETIEQLTRRHRRNPRSDDRQLNIDELNDIHDELLAEGHSLEDPPKPLANETVTRYLINPVFELCKLAESRAFAQDLHSKPERASHKLRTAERSVVLSSVQQLKLEEVCKEEGSDLYVVFVAALESMLRKSNLIYLKWRHVCLTRRTITVVQKGTKTFERHINDRLLAILRKLKEIRDSAELRGIKMPYVFTRRLPSGQRVPLSKDISSDFKALAARAGCEEIRFHDLRRTGATRMYESRHDIREVMLALGHAREETTWKYISKKSGDRAAAERARVAHDDEQMRIARLEVAAEREGRSLASTEQLAEAAQSGEWPVGFFADVAKNATLLPRVGGPVALGEDRATAATVSKSQAPGGTPLERLAAYAAPGSYVSRPVLNISSGDKAKKKVAWTDPSYYDLRERDWRYLDIESVDTAWVRFRERGRLDVRCDKYRFQATTEAAFWEAFARCCGVDPWRLGSRDEMTAEAWIATLLSATADVLWPVADASSHGRDRDPAGAIVIA